MNHSGWIMKWGVGYSSAPLEHLHGNKTLSKPSILSSDEANKPCVKQKAVSNPLLRTTQPTANTAGIYELLQYRKMPELLPVTYQVQPVWPFIKQGYLCGARKHVMKTSVHEAPDHHIDSSVVLISTPWALQLKFWIQTPLPSPQGPRSTVASLNPIQTCCKLETPLLSCPSMAKTEYRISYRCTCKLRVLL